MSDKKTIQDLLQIMARLRDPEGGCPWDQQQTFKTIAPYTIEEAYEVADAIEQGEMDELRDELGDLLFQVVFYAQMASEEQQFDFHDVVDAISNKMIRRHPHVFADASFENEEQLRHAWEQQKSSERQARVETGEHSHMDGVATALPALMRAEKLQKRAARVGFDWPHVDGAFDKCREEINEVEEAVAGGNMAHIEEELGDLLFAMVNVTRMMGADAEQVLRRANDKFARRFRAMERYLRDAGQPDLSMLDLDTLDAAWDAVKAAEK